MTNACRDTRRQGQDRRRWLEACLENARLVNHNALRDSCSYHRDNSTRFEVRSLKSLRSKFVDNEHLLLSTFTSSWDQSILLKLLEADYRTTSQDLPNYYMTQFCNTENQVRRCTAYHHSPTSEVEVSAALHERYRPIAPQSFRLQPIAFRMGVVDTGLLLGLLKITDQFSLRSYTI